MRIGFPGTHGEYRWQSFLEFLIPETNIEIVDLNPDYGRNKLPENIDLVFFEGGEDIHPILYGGRYHNSIHANLKRDWNEKIIYDFYKNKETLFAGICRGSQFLNVMCGGTLFEDLWTLEIGHNSFHNVVIEQSTSLLYYLSFMKDDIKEDDIIGVNSLHHQAVKDLGVGLKSVLYDEDFAVIEGFESNDGKIRAVQSHPEMNDSQYKSRFEIMQWLLRAKEEENG
jgi:putative glutamine amidotransferase